MNQAIYRKAAELAFIRSVPDSIVDDLKPGRLKNKCLKLRQLVDKELPLKALTTDKDIQEVRWYIKHFGKLSGWEGNKKHITTVVAFLLDMIEESDADCYDKILPVLNDLHDYFERHKAIKLPCLHAGVIAGEKWLSLKGDDK